jgi:hypothetical protein
MATLQNLKESFFGVSAIKQSKVTIGQSQVKVRHGGHCLLAHIKIITMIYSVRKNQMNENNIDDNINFSEDFKYPTESTEEKNFDVDSTDIIIRLSTLIFSSSKPKMALAALLYASGVDVGIYLNCDNTVTSISTMLGESKQNFSALIKKVKEDFSLKSNTGKTDLAKTKYKQSNYRKTNES